MDLTTARRLAQENADRIGHQIVLVADPIGQAEDESDPYGYCPTLAIPVFIPSLRYGRIVEVIEPRKSASDRRADLENTLVERFRADPNSIPRRMGFPVSGASRT
jgi:hypothetical protein